MGTLVTRFEAANPIPSVTALEGPFRGGYRAYDQNGEINLCKYTKAESEQLTRRIVKYLVPVPQKDSSKEGVCFVAAESVFCISLSNRDHGDIDLRVGVEGYGFRTVEKVSVPDAREFIDAVKRVNGSLRAITELDRINIEGDVREIETFYIRPAFVSTVAHKNCSENTRSLELQFINGEGLRLYIGDMRMYSLQNAFVEAEQKKDLADIQSEYRSTKAQQFISEVIKDTDLIAFPEGRNIAFRPSDISWVEANGMFNGYLECSFRHPKAKSLHVNFLNDKQATWLIGFITKAAVMAGKSVLPPSRGFDAPIGAGVDG